MPKQEILVVAETPHPVAIAEYNVPSLEEKMPSSWWYVRRYVIAVAFSSLRSFEVRLFSLWLMICVDPAEVQGYATVEKGAYYRIKTWSRFHREPSLR